MKSAEQFLASLGLEWYNPERAEEVTEKPIVDVLGKKNLEEKIRTMTRVEAERSIIYELTLISGFFRIVDKEKYGQWMQLGEFYSKMPKELLAYIDITLVDQTDLVNTYNTDVRNFPKKARNEPLLAKMFPAYNLKKAFNPEEAKQYAIQEFRTLIRDSRIGFGDKSQFQYQVIASGLYDLFVRDLAISPQPQK